MWQCDHSNHVEAAAVRGSRHLKVLRLAVRDVRSRNPACPGALLGAVAYADTFLEVGGGKGGRGRPRKTALLLCRCPRLTAAHSQDCATSVQVPALDDRPATLLNLTESLPALSAFSALGPEAAAAARAARSFARLASASPALALASGERGAAAAAEAKAARRKGVQRVAAAQLVKEAAARVRKAALSEDGEGEGVREGGQCRYGPWSS